MTALGEYPLSQTRIEIIAIGNEKVYSVGAIVVSAKGDVYLSHKIKDSDFHLSRHASGETHWKSNKIKLCQHIRKGQPIKEFKGFEFLQLYAFILDALPELYKEYNMKVCDGVFCIDRRAFSKGAFNIQVGILTKEGLPSLLTSSERLSKRQVYIFPNCHPMIAITVGDAQIESAKT